MSSCASASDGRDAWAPPPSSPRRTSLPFGSLAVGDEGDLACFEARSAHDGRRPGERGARVATAGDGLDAVDLVAQEAGAPAAHAAIDGDQPEPVGRRGGGDDVPGHGFELVEQRPTVHHGRGAQRVVDEDRDRRRRMARSDPARDRARRSHRDRQQRQHAQQHQ
jgi:hypothetical protein